MLVGLHEVGAGDEVLTIQCELIGAPDLGQPLRPPAVVGPPHKSEVEGPEVRGRAGKEAAAEGLLDHRLTAMIHFGLNVSLPYCHLRMVWRGGKGEGVRGWMTWAWAPWFHTHSRGEDG